MPIPGVGELVLALVIILIIFGPGRLPEVGRVLGRSLSDFRRAAGQESAGPSSSDEDVKRG